MKIVGIIVEYNPLHNGHKLHINKIKQEAKADLIIAALSSSFTMRGEISVFDKFLKTKQTLLLGVDLVVEIPFVSAVNNADIFAINAVRLLNLLGVNEIWIGSENNNNLVYQNYYEHINSLAYQNELKKQLNLGLSYKMASDKAIEISGLTPLLSNDILGLFYYKAIKDNDYKITLKTIKREGNNYLDTTINSSIASATSLRKKENDITNYVPDFVLADYRLYGFRSNDDLFSLLKYRILSSTKKELNKLFLIEEGIENRLFDIYEHESFDSFLSSLKTKRYTDSRIRRTLLYVMFNISKKVMSEIKTKPLDFVRILGYNQNGKKYLSSVKKNLTIYTNIKEGINPILDIELRITKLLDFIYKTNLLSLEQKGPIALF